MRPNLRHPSQRPHSIGAARASTDGVAPPARAMRTRHNLLTPPTRVSPRARRCARRDSRKDDEKKRIGATRKKRIGGDENDDDATNADERATKTTARSNAAMARRTAPARTPRLGFSRGDVERVARRARRDVAVVERRRGDHLHGYQAKREEKTDEGTV